MVCARADKFGDPVEKGRLVGGDGVKVAGSDRLTFRADLPVDGLQGSRSFINRKWSERDVKIAPHHYPSFSLLTHIHYFAFSLVFQG